MFFARTRDTQRRAMMLLVVSLTLPGGATGVARAADAMPATPVTDIAVTAPLPRTAHEQALQAILDDGRTQVDALLARIQADPALVDALQQEICRVKAETNVRFLQKQVELARADDDEARLDEATRALDNALNPPTPAVTSAGAAKQGVVK